MLGKVAVGVVRESRKFRAPIYTAYCAVIFATAQLSCTVETFSAVSHLHYQLPSTASGPSVDISAEN